MTIHRILAIAGLSVATIVAAACTDTTGAQNIEAGDCFTPSVSEFITASFETVDCEDAEPIRDMKVEWVETADAFGEVDAIASRCVGMPYVPDDEETFDDTDGVIVCASPVFGS